MLKRPELALKAYSPSPRDSCCFDREGESKAIDQPSFGISTLTGTAPARPVNASTTAGPIDALGSVVVLIASPSVLSATFERTRGSPIANNFCGQIASILSGEEQ